MKLLYTCKDVKLSSYNLFITINGTRTGLSIVNWSYEWTIYHTFYYIMYLKKRNILPRHFCHGRTPQTMPYSTRQEAWICKAKKQRFIRQTRGRNHVSVSCTDIKSHAKSLRQVWRANLHRRHMYTRMHTYAGKRGETNRPIREWHVPTTNPYPLPLSILQPEFQADDMFFD